MSAVTIVGRDLVLPDWQVIAACGGLDFEMGGTMNVGAFYDPQLSPDLPTRTPTAQDYRRVAPDADPELIARLVRQAQPSVVRSPATQQILAFSFRSQTAAPHFDWVLNEGLEQLLFSAQSATKRMGRPSFKAAELLALLLLHVGRLEDWSEVNRSRFSSYRIVVRAPVAEALMLRGEEAADGLVCIHQAQIPF